MVGHLGKLKLSLVVVADVALSAANLLEIGRGRGVRWRKGGVATAQ